MRVSAGIVLYRHKGNGLEVLLAHPGGPFFERRDNGHWSIPKAEPDTGEPLPAAARREFKEETGIALPDGAWLDRGTIKQKCGRIVDVRGVVGDLDLGLGQREALDQEWPAKCRRRQRFDEIDQVEWFSSDEARRRIKETQIR